LYRYLGGSSKALKALLNSLRWYLPVIQELPGDGEKCKMWPFRIIEQSANEKAQAHPENQ